MIMNSKELDKSMTATISKEVIEKLFEVFEARNGRTKHYVSPQSGGFWTAIEELWFDTQGYDYYDNPYPDVIESTLNQDGSLTIIYQPQI